MKIKSILILLLGLLALPVTAQTVSPAAAKTAALHNARNSLDYTGSYKPHAMVGANEIQEIEIEDESRYCYTTGSGGKVSGTYQWSSQGNQIVLEHPGDRPLVFFVGENHLKLLSKGSQEGLVFQKE